jgi:ferritin-like protein
LKEDEQKDRYWIKIIPERIFDFGTKIPKDKEEKKSLGNGKRKERISKQTPNLDVEYNITWIQS